MAEFSGEHHVAGLPDEGIASVVVSQSENQSSTLDPVSEIQRIGQRGSEWLVADDMNAAFEESFRGSMMQMVRRHNRNDFNAVRPL